VGNLKRRVERLEGGRKGNRLAVIFARQGETVAEAVQRYLAQHPEDADVPKMVFSRSRQAAPSGPPPPRPKAKDSPEAPGPDPQCIYE
jgi:hypothetical protein